jgi:hypothetical protein
MFQKQLLYYIVYKIQMKEKKDIFYNHNLITN